MITKILVFILIFAILFLIKEAYLFYNSWKNEKLDMTLYRLIGIGLSISYILTIIITGFGV